MSTLSQNLSRNNLEQCLKCTICTTACPVAAVNPNYAGPKQAGPDGQRYRLKSDSYYDATTLKQCLNCKRCEVACPHDVKIADMILGERLAHEDTHPLRDRILANTDVMGTIATHVAPIVNATLALSPVRKLMDATLAVDSRRTMPAYANTTFESWYRRKARPIQCGFPNEVLYFHGCYVNYNFPQLGQDFVKVMNAIGYGVRLIDGEKCCGVALAANGFAKSAKRQARHNVEAMQRATAKTQLPILTTSSSCTFNLRDEYPHVLGIDNNDIRSNITLATGFILRAIDGGRVHLAFKPDFTMRVAYHTACHMERLGWAIYSINLLRLIPGIELTVLPSQCCGIAGTYGFKRENYETSQAIGAPLFRRIAEVAPDVVATDCETCKWQIEMSAHVAVMNPISILAQAIDVEATIKLNQA